MDNAIKEQVFETLDNTQLALLGASNAIGDDSIYSEADQTITYTIVVKGNNLVLAYNNAYSNKPDLNSNEWQQICQDVLKCYNHNDGKPYHGIYKNKETGVDSYYVIRKFKEDRLVLTKTYSDNTVKMEDMLINSVVYITIIVVGFFFIILMMWVVTLIHPLNQIRNYIERVKTWKRCRTACQP